MIMKTNQYLLLLSAMMLSVLGFGQTGTGVVFETDASYAFAATTVDSTSSFTFEVINDVGAEQTIYFSALDAPFSLVDNSPLVIAANDTASVTLQFQPTELGSFSGSLEAAGSVFGSATLNFSGEGIQVVLEWTPESLAFETTAIGQTNSQIVSVTSSGNGDGVISGIEFSNPVFSVDSAASTFTIAEGTSADLTFVFAPIGAGNQTGTATLHTNDPNNAQVVITLSATGISEVSGDICDMVWTAENSPYTLVGDVVVPEGCTLIIAENVHVNFQGFELSNQGSIEIASGVNVNGDDGVIDSDGSIQISGTSEAEVLISELSHIGNGSIELEYVIWDPQEVKTGIYSNDFTEDYDGWSYYSPSGFYGPPSYPYLWLDYCTSSNYCYNWHFTSPVFELETTGYVSNVSFKLDEYYCSSYGPERPVFQYKVNGASNWVDYDYEFPNRNINQSFSANYDISLDIENVNQFQFRLYWGCRSGSSLKLDDVVIGMSSLNNYSDPTGTVRSFAGISEIKNSQLGSAVFSGDSCFVDNSEMTSLSIISGSSQVTINNSDFSNDNSADAVYVSGSQNSISIFATEFVECLSGVNSVGSNFIDVSYSRFSGCNKGLFLPSTGLSMTNSMIWNCSEQGVYCGSPTILNHCNLAFNGGTGLVLTGNNFHTLNNSILWGNNETNYTQIDIGGGVISTSYSTVQGQSGYGVTGSGQFYWGEGVIEADPLFADDDLHLNTYSPCVDGGQPWLMDAHMPYGLGGVRADMGMYGGPDNAYWGGLALPDGASNLQAVEDSPQDQGNTVGLTFSSSFYDNSDLVNNVTHYAFWRHFDPTGEAIASVAEGNWELLGEMPSLSLNNYAYQAPTLGNTNTFGDFSSCYFVAAHTADDDTYWISNVVCGESVDNLAPDDPDLNGLVLETGEAQISWSVPTEEDYDYTEIFNDDGFSAEVGTDTLVVDAAVQEGNSYTYTAINYDVNGNASDPSTITLDIPAGLDIIPLTAGWNLISTDRTPTDASIEAVFATLEPGNLDYITGFDGGVQFYDPEGLSFLNSLSALTNGQGYWVRVAEDDTLEVSGASLQANYLPALNAGWNIIGFPNAADVAPADYFADFIIDGSLEYVTGFDGGSTYFDPNGLSFLNSLTALENGLGYWVKVTEAFDPNGMVLTGDEPMAALTGASHQHANPNFMLVNGTSDLAQAAGTQVDVRRADGSLVAHLPVLEGGYLMTTALFGDDPSTDAIEGLQVGEELHFEVQGQRAEQSLVYSGQMDIKHVALTFGAVQAMASVFPNPFEQSLQFSGTADATGKLSIQLTDVQGRIVAERPISEVTSGAWNVTWTVPNLAPGSYTCTVILDGKRLSTIPLMHVN